MQAGATYRGTVYPWQCDHVGHMNIMWYVGMPGSSPRASTMPAASPRSALPSSSLAAR